MRTYLFVFCIFFLICKSSFPDTSTQSFDNYGKAPQLQNYFGAAAGYATGYGISYKRWFSSAWGLQVNFAPFYTTTRDRYDSKYRDFDVHPIFPDSGTFSFGSVSFGVTVLHAVAEGNFFRAVLYSGMNTLIKYENSSFYYSSNANPYQPVQLTGTIDKTRTKVTLGGGGGFELYAWRFSFSLMLGIRGGLNFPDVIPEFYPSIEGGIHFGY